MFVRLCSVLQLFIAVSRLFDGVTMYAGLHRVDHLPMHSIVYVQVVGVQAGSEDCAQFAVLDVVTPHCAHLSYLSLAQTLQVEQLLLGPCLSVDGKCQKTQNSDVEMMSLLKKKINLLVSHGVPASSTGLYCYLYIICICIYICIVLILLLLIQYPPAINNNNNSNGYF